MIKNGYTVKEIKKNMFVLDEKGTRAFIIIGPESALMVDTGFGINDIKSVTDELTDKPITVILTHSDGDHTGGIKNYKNVLMHKDERTRFDMGTSSDGLTINYVADGDTVSCGDYRFTVLHVPGHTEGSIVLFEKGKRFVIAGDSIQRHDVFLAGEGRSLNKYMESMKRLRTMEDGMDEIYSAHGDYPQPASLIDEHIECCELYLAGKLTGVVPDFGPGVTPPGKIYWNGSVGLFMGD